LVIALSGQTPSQLSHSKQLPQDHAAAGFIGGGFFIHFPTTVHHPRALAF